MENLSENMNINAYKIELVKMILEVENPAFIDKISDFIKENKSTDFWDELNPSEKADIKKGIHELDEGKRIKYQEFLKKIS